MVNVNKSFGSYFQDGTELPLFHLTANVGASYEDYLTTGVSVGGRLNLIPNLFSAPTLLLTSKGPENRISIPATLRHLQVWNWDSKIIFT